MRLPAGDRPDDGVSGLDTDEVGAEGFAVGVDGMGGAVLLGLEALSAGYDHQQSDQGWSRREHLPTVSDAGDGEIKSFRMNSSLRPRNNGASHLAVPSVCHARWGRRNRRCRKIRWKDR